MQFTQKIFTKITIPLLLGILLFLNQAIAAKFILNENVPEYYLQGTLEESSKYNFNIDPGNEITDYLTVVNNTEKPINYKLEGLDSTINNQQMIVFKANKAESPNLGKWIKFENQDITVEPKSTLQIPFTINVPKDAFPGSYNGGISIQKIPNESENISEQKSGFMVKVQTRQVLSLIVNVSGEIQNKFLLGELSYDEIKNSYSFSIKNTGNTILSFQGTLNISGNDLFKKIEKEIKIEKFPILPNTTINQKIPYLSPPLFGDHKITLNGEILYFDGIKNSNQPLENVQLHLSHSFIAWHIIYIIFVGLTLLILSIIVVILKKKHYLKNCIEYTVQPNDTINLIAQNYKMSWKKLAKINKIAAPYTITPGQKILVHEKQKN